MRALEQPSVENSGRESIYYHWLPRDTSTSVLMAIHVVEGIEAEAIAGFSALPRRGLEIGGILLGWVEESVDRRTVHIESSVPFEAEHLTGPSFVLSDRDLTSLGEQIDLLRQPGNHYRIVGYYRTQTRAGLSLDAEDKKLIMRYFCEPENVFLLIKPKLGEASTAAFFVWEGDQMNSAASYLEFPFQRRELLSGGHPISALPEAPIRDSPGLNPSAPAVEQSDPKRVSPIPSGQPRPPQHNGGRLLRTARLAAIAIVVVSACTLAGYLVTNRLKSPDPTEVPAVAGDPGRDLANTPPDVTPAPVQTAPSVASFVLQAHRHGNALRVTWDRRDRSIESSDHGLLFVDDGSSNRQIRVSNTQLHQGSLLYKPTSSDITFRMQVFSPAPSVSEPVRLVGTSRRGRGRNRHMIFEEQPAKAIPEGVAETEAPGTSPRGTSVSEVPIEVSPRPSAAGEPAEVKSASRSSRQNPSSPIAISMETEPPSAVRRMVHRGLHPFRDRSSSFKPAYAVQLLQPQMPPDLRPKAGAGSVDIKAKIGTNGKVKIEQIVRKGLSQQATAPILAAVRRSRFEAATIENRRVASHVVLHYQF